MESRKGELNGAMPAMTPSGFLTDIEIWPGMVIGMVSPMTWRASPAATRSASTT